MFPRSSFLPEVSWKMLVLEGWMRTFGESLVGNARFEAWNSLLVKVSWEMLALQR